MPPVQFTRAAEVTRRYELDTDGIDVGATYLIVNAGTAGSIIGAAVGIGGIDENIFLRFIDGKMTEDDSRNLIFPR